MTAYPDGKLKMYVHVIVSGLGSGQVVGYGRWASYVKGKNDSFRPGMISGYLVQLDTRINEFISTVPVHQNNLILDPTFDGE